MNSGNKNSNIEEPYYHFLNQLSVTTDTVCYFEELLCCTIEMVNLTKVIQSSLLLNTSPFKTWQH